MGLEKKNGALKTAKTVGIMAVIIFLAKIMGLLREVFVASIFGQSYESDVLNTATQIPLLFFDMTLGVAILSTFVPVFNKYLENDGRKRAMDFASTFITVVAFVVAVASIIGMIFSKQIVAFIVPGYGEEKMLETAHLLRILFPAIVFTAVAYIVVGLLQSFGEFNIPSLISVVSNLVMILYLIIFKDKFGLEGVILSMLFAWAMQLFIQLPSLKKKGFSYHFRLNFKDEGIKEAAVLALPVLVSSWVQPFCTVINSSFGSFMGDGAVSGLNWANKIYIIMVGVFAYAVTNFIFPKLSRLNARGSDDAFAETTRTSLGWIIFIIAFIASLFIALSDSIIKVVFERGEFSAADTKITSTALFYYSFGMVGYAICEVLNKSFYAIRDGKSPMYSSIFGIMVNFAAAFLFVNFFNMGVGGLALASAVSSVSIAAVLMIIINRKKKGIINLRFIINMFKTAIAAILSCFTAMAVEKLVGQAFDGGMLLTLAKLCVCSLPALLVYAAIGVLLRIDEIMFVLKRGKC